MKVIIVGAHGEAKELINRAKEYHQKDLEEISNRVKDLGLDNNLIELPGLTPGMLVTLGEQKILTLNDFHINGLRINGQPGVWAKDNNGCNKIAALGIRISSWITFHGISINVNPNLDEFNNIVPCGIKNSGVTSFYKLGKKIALKELDISLKKNFNKVFGNEGLFKLK